MALTCPPPPCAPNKVNRMAIPSPRIMPIPPTYAQAMAAKKARERAENRKLPIPCAMTREEWDKIEAERELSAFVEGKATTYHKWPGVTQ